MKMQKKDMKKMKMKKSKKHSDVMEDTKLVKKMVKKKALK